MVKTKPVIKAADLEKTIITSIEALSNAAHAAGTAVTKKIAENNKLQTEIRRHLKKKTMLTKRSKAAVTKYKKSPDVASKKSVDAVANDLNLIQVALKNARASKVLVLAELVALRAATKRLSAYTKAITAADKVLNKPVVKRKRSTKKAI